MEDVSHLAAIMCQYLMKDGFFFSTRPRQVRTNPPASGHDGPPSRHQLRSRACSEGTAGEVLDWGPDHHHRSRVGVVVCPKKE